MALPKIKCPTCGGIISPQIGIIKTTNSYSDCIRRCEECEIGFSNSKTAPTIIYNRYEENIPEQLRADLDFSLNHSINELNRNNKKIKFGFSTSEDALTWSFFKYFVVNDLLNELLDILDIESKSTSFDIYLWGTNICKVSEDSFISNGFIKASDSFKESSSRRTEPDVIIRLEDRLVFIEVKYLSSNELKSDKERFKKYRTSGVSEEDVFESEHYELLRNWAFAEKLSDGNEFELINLAPNKLFCDKNRGKLKKFEDSLLSPNGTFKKMKWEEVLEKVNKDNYEMWFKEYLNDKVVNKETLYGKMINAQTANSSFRE